MAENGAKTPVLDNEEAINVALRAERDARQTVERCRREADETLAEARGKARRIQERTDRRITRMHRDCATALDREVAAMLENGPPSESPEQSFQREQEVLDAAVKHLAERLTIPDAGGDKDL